MSAATTDETVTVLGRDDVGVIAEGYGMRYYLTPCCGASAKGCDGYIGCRACYAEIDPSLGGVPDSTVRFADGKITTEPRTIRFVEVYGDGIPYEKWAATALPARVR